MLPWCETSRLRARSSCFLKELKHYYPQYFHDSDELANERLKNSTLSCLSLLKSRAT